jgi:hypothetical protein
MDIILSFWQDTVTNGRIKQISANKNVPLEIDVSFFAMVRSFRSCFELQ